MLSNVGTEHFDQDSFVTAYNQDTRLQKLVHKFDDAGLVFKGGEEPQAEPEDKTVDKMANRATAKALK